jgi:hypothetical protein
MSDQNFDENEFILPWAASNGVKISLGEKSRQGVSRLAFTSEKQDNQRVIMATKIPVA